MCKCVCHGVYVRVCVSVTVCVSVCVSVCELILMWMESVIACAYMHPSVCVSHVAHSIQFKNFVIPQGAILLLSWRARKIYKK